jgi:signal transduction histidine kinase
VVDPEDGRVRPVVEPDDVPDGLIVADEHARVVVVNRVATRLLRVRARDLIGKHLSDALALQDRDGRDWWATARPYDGLRIRTGHPEFSLFLPNGRELLVAAKFLRPGGPTDEVKRVVVTLRSAQLRIHEDGERSNLIATVAHELRSPLTSVKGFTATLLRNWERFTDDQRKLLLETVEADADRLARLITDLLDVARIESNRLSVRRQPIELAAYLERTVASLVDSGRADADRLVLLVEEPVPRMWLDQDKIDQVLANLIDNALRHGAGKVTVRLSAWRDGVRIVVDDEGPGIPEAERERAFGRFWRGKGGTRGGSGLGLYIVRGLVEAHDGSVHVESSPSGGARFVVELPNDIPEGLAD